MLELSFQIRPAFRAISISIDRTSMQILPSDSNRKPSFFEISQRIIGQISFSKLPYINVNIFQSNHINRTHPDDQDVRVYDHVHSNHDYESADMLRPHRVNGFGLYQPHRCSRISYR